MPAFLEAKFKREWGNPEHFYRSWLMVLVEVIAQADEDLKSVMGIYDASIS